MRGGPAFAVSLVLTSIEPRMRARAELGAWQVGGRAVLCAFKFGVHAVNPGMSRAGRLAAGCCVADACTLLSAR